VHVLCVFVRVFYDSLSISRSTLLCGLLLHGVWSRGHVVTWSRDHVVKWYPVRLLIIPFPRHVVRVCYICCRVISNFRSHASAIISAVVFKLNHCSKLTIHRLDCCVEWPQYNSRLEAIAACFLQSTRRNVTWLNSGRSLAGLDWQMLALCRASTRVRRFVKVGGRLRVCSLLAREWLWIHSNGKNGN